ncbi:MAG: right-handed parallel beta-helix repeat-containing protein [Enhygromyxa sp.]
MRLAVVTRGALSILPLLCFACTSDAPTDELDSSETSAGEGDSGDGDGDSGDGDGDGDSGDGDSGDGDGDSGDGDGDDPLPDPSCEGIGEALDELGTVPGATSLPYPTLEHVSVLWEIDGDSNENGTVTVRYRSEGGAWHEGTPLRRVPAGELEGFAWPNRHAGTVFGLSPGTTYEIELFLRDPDGGCEIRTLEVTTRTRPRAIEGARVLDATPATLTQVANASQPGDVIALAPGNYATFTFPKDGTAEAPIVILGDGGAGNVVIDGDLRLDGRAHVIVDGLTVNGQIKFNAATGLAIVNNTVNASADGIAMLTRGENIYVADNTVSGSTTWTEAALGVDGDNLGEGIILTGPGHVIEHNRVSGFRDAISLLEGGGAVDQFSIDILYNDIDSAADDGIEADFCSHNCRIIGNRLTNTFMALSSQPGLGGPTYFIRNSLYSVILSAFKLQRSSIGDVVWHNTVVKNGDALGIYTTDVFARQQFRNNLFIGGPGGSYGGWSSGSGRVIDLDAADPSCDLDYDGFGSTTGEFVGNIGATAFSSLAELQATTTEAHAVEVGLEVFAAPVAYPHSPFPALSPADLRLAPEGAAIDAGVLIPGLNAGHSGAAPDLGAHELGEPLPSYGPR